MADVQTVETKACMICHKRSKITIPTEALRRWNEGAFIQVAWPDSTPEEREMLITGTHPDCWDAAFPEEEDD